MRLAMLRAAFALQRSIATLALGAAVTLIAPHAAAAPCAGFTDVDDTVVGAGFCSNVAWLRNRSITLGCSSATLYCPNDPVSRLAMAAFMNRLGVALTPFQLHVDASLGAIDPDANPVVCQTADFVAEDFARVAYADARFSATATGDLGLAADLVMSLDGGASWANLNLFSNRGFIAANQWGTFADIGFAALDAEQTARWGLRIGRVGAPGGTDIAASRCELRVRVYGQDENAPPVLKVSATIPNVSEVGPTPGQFTVTRSGNKAAALPVQFTLGGSASNCADYVCISSITIAAGQASVQVPVTVLQDSLAEGTETAILTLTPDASYLIATPSATVTIANGPPPTNSAPVVNAGADQTITLPAQANLGGTANDDGNPNPPGVLTIAWSKVSGPGTVSFGNAAAAATSSSFSVDGVYVLRLTANDSLLLAQDDVQITVNAQPSIVAPPPDPSVATNLPDATAFLYTGPSPVQTGVASGTIIRERAAVVRGRVLRRDGTPLPNAVITILDHPEFGQTASRSDGAFDLAVNGGRQVTLNYAATGFLPVQRRLGVRWLDYSVAPDVVLIPLDTRVTAIAANAPAIQVHEASPETDSAGTRKSVLMFPAGTGAQMRLLDGSTAPLTTLNVRASEFTVGPRGPSAMPGLLPRDSAYTYAAELSVDEAIAAGATRVEFTQAIALYVDNFLGFPTGTPVPTGYYDRVKATWVASANGRVIQITGITGGAADVDTVGTSGMPPIALDLAERQQLAARYPVGKSLWRTTVTHFTPYDCNWPYELPGDAEAPNQPPPRIEPEVDRCGANASGSIIECQNQVLRQSVPVAGTPFTLNYASARVPGRKTDNRLLIPVSGPSVPASLRRIDVTVNVAGRTFALTAPPAPNQTLSFDWDGKDAYGRTLQGRQPVTGRVSYVYDAIYTCRAWLIQLLLFGRPCTVPVGIAARVEQTLDQSFLSSVGVLDARGVGIGGWTLDGHHTYDPIGLVLHLGDGRRRSASSFVSVIQTIGGGGTSGQANGTPATQAVLREPDSVLVGPDGTVYFANQSTSATINASNQIRHIAPGGLLGTTAGTGSSNMTFNGDGLLATATNMGPSGRMTFAPDGTLHFIDGWNRRVRRIGLDGRVSTVAGTGIAAYNGDGIPATQANLNITAGGIVFAPDGTLYLTDRLNQRVRRVDTDGIITTVAGTGTQGYNGDGIPATQAALSTPDDLALAADGSLLIADFGNNRIRRVGPDGIITTIAGTGAFAFNGNGLPATQTNINGPSSIAFGPDGSLYVVDQNRLRRIDPGGIMATIAGGTGASTFNGNGIPAAQANVATLGTITVDSAGAIYLPMGGVQDRVRTIRSPMPGFNAGDLAIASEDGRLLRQFNAAGRHLRSINTLTGAVLQEYTYDSAGRLATVVEKTGGTDNVTIIQRDANGAPSAIVPPFGAMTQLAVDGNGFLSRVTNPANEATQFAYTASGLMQTLIDPRGNSRAYGHDALGRLVQATDPAGGIQAFVRSDLSDGHSIVRTSATGRTTTYAVANLANGDTRLATTHPGGETSVTVLRPNGTSTYTAPDGMQVNTTLGPDPRFGMLAPVATRVETRTPGGITKLRLSSLTASLAVPSNPLSHTQLSRTTTVNGQAATTVYTTATRTTVSTSPAGRTLTTVVDTLGRIVSRQQAGLNAITVAYDARGRIASATVGSGPGSRATQFAYDVSGHLQTVTDPLGRITQYARDAAGRVTSKTLPDGRVVGYAFDATGNLAAFVPPGRTATQYQYSARDELIGEAPPVVVPGGPTSFVFAADGGLLTVQRPDTRNVAIVYDAAGRPVSRQLSTGGTVTHVDTVAHDASGRIASLAAAGGVTTAYSYDGALVIGESVTGPVPGAIAQTFDSFMRVATRSVNGSSVTFAYDADGLITTSGAMTIVRSAQHGLATSATLGAVTTTYAYDSFGEATQSGTTHNALPLFGLTLTRDALGRITQKSETIVGVTDNFVYTYDLAGRLSGVSRNGIVSESYQYDSNGNRVTATVGGVPATGTYDAQDRLVQYGAATFTHSAAGERQQRSVGGATTVYQYDQQRSLRGVTLPAGTAITYVIDGNGRRVGKRVNGGLVQGFLYNDSLRPAAELDGSGAVVSRFVYARGSSPAYLTRGGATFRLVTDQVGSVRLVVEAATGAIAQRIDYDAFGNVVQDTNPGFQPFGFAGGLYDRDTGLVRFGARDYDPVTGRWTVKDPAGYSGGSTNLYGYTGNDPVNRIDPAGHEDVSVAVAEQSVDPARIIQDIIAIVSADPAFREYVDSVFSFVPGVSSGAVRNFFMAVCDIYTRIAACDPHNDDANRYVCTGVAEEAIDLIRRAMEEGRLGPIQAIDQISRRVDDVDHTAVVITLPDGTTMVLDWHFTLNSSRPLVQTPEQWCMGGCL